MKKKRVTRCSAHLCFNKSSNVEKLTFHRFPSNEETCRTWLRRAGNSELALLPADFLTKRRCLCSKHFESKCYKPGSNFLKNGSVPTLFDPKVTELSEEVVAVYPLKKRTLPIKKSAQGIHEKSLPTTNGTIPQVNTHSVITLPSSSGTSIEEVHAASLTHNQNLSSVIGDHPCGSGARSMQGTSVEEVIPSSNLACTDNGGYFTPLQSELDMDGALKFIEIAGGGGFLQSGAFTKSHTEGNQFLHGNTSTAHTETTSSCASEDGQLTYIVLEGGPVQWVTLRNSNIEDENFIACTFGLDQSKHCPQLASL